jgi:hypothetical protein
MAVATEQFTPADLEHSPGPLRFEGLERRSDGRWMFVYRAAGEAVLRDGRRVEVYRRVEVPATDYWRRRRAR